jgi:hypothetical protein
MAEFKFRFFYPVVLDSTMLPLLLNKDEKYSHLHLITPDEIPLDVVGSKILAQASAA